MPEGSNVEVAHHLSEHDHHFRAEPWQEKTEIVEVIILAIVAIATAWSGYQAAKWDGKQAFDYGTSTRLHTQANDASILGGQQKLLDVSTFNTWIQATTSGQPELADLYERRFSPEFKTAFDAWIALDPFHNPDAPPGPSYMPEYRNSQIEQGKALNDEATSVFDEGTEARRQAEEYVQATLLFATVLFLLALSPRFKLRNVRIGVAVVAAALLIFGAVVVAFFPRL